RRWYAVLATLLGLLLGLQIAWQQRTELLREFPQLGALCDMVACRPTTVYAPHAFEVLQRDIRPATNEPGTLSLSASVRNGASLAQRLPDIQLSLLDTNGNVLVRRRLSPQEYRFPPPPEGQLVAPAEVFTIGLDFADPGSLATGFTIDFL
ncbi:MAG: DUF3426 domain-containing protein, partial [Gammaproteobacteria bacterium]|nr:DUF3426 domain-containing protein [Gammaproteobacteria bacterium]